METLLYNALAILDLRSQLVPWSLEHAKKRSNSLSSIFKAYQVYDYNYNFTGFISETALFYKGPVPISSGQN